MWSMEIYRAEWGIVLDGLSQKVDSCFPAVGIKMRLSIQRRLPDRLDDHGDMPIPAFLDGETMHQLPPGCLLWPACIFWNESSLQTRVRLSATDQSFMISSPAPLTHPWMIRGVRRPRVTASRRAPRRCGLWPPPTGRRATPCRCAQRPSSGCSSGAEAGRRARCIRGAAPCATHAVST
jgi:hypothetical protein